MGLTPTGFVAPTFDEIKLEIETELLATVDPALDLSPDQPMGQIVGIVAQREARQNELLSVAYGGFDPRSAEGFLLDGVCAFTGTTRDGATKSRVSANIDVDAGFTATAGTMQANVNGYPGIVFVNATDLGPLTAGVHSVVFEAAVYGPVVANAGTLTVISAPVGGWNSITNPTDALVGKGQETDTSLRLRREQELSAAGSCTTDAIRADLLQIEHVDGTRPVQQAFVFENTSLVTDADGVPGKAFEAVIFDGITPLATNAEVGAVIWKNKPSGVEAHGATSVTVSAAQGRPRTVKFSRATVRQVWLELDLSVDPVTFPGTGAALVKAAIVSLGGAALNLGIDVVAARVKAWALTVPGVLDVPALRLGFAASPVGTSNLVITARQIAALDTSRISVTTATGTP